MIPYRSLAISSTLLLGMALAGPASGPPARSSAARGAEPAPAAGATAASQTRSQAPGGGTAAPATPQPAPPPATAHPASPPAAPATPLPAGPPGEPTRRITIPTPEGKIFPYTIEVPASWQVQSSKTVAGVFLGPPGVAEPESDSRMIYVRVSPASVIDPEAVAANIKQSVPADKSWSAPLVEVRDVGGVRGVLVRMDSGAGEQARSTLVLKLPLAQTSLDFMASAPRAEFERQLAGYQRVLLSVLPAR